MCPYENRPSKEFRTTVVERMRYDNLTNMVTIGDSTIMADIRISRSGIAMQSEKWSAMQKGDRGNRRTEKLFRMFISRRCCYGTKNYRGHCKFQSKVSWESRNISPQNLSPLADWLHHDHWQDSWSKGPDWIFGANLTPRPVEKGAPRGLKKLWCWKTKK